MAVCKGQLAAAEMKTKRKNSLSNKPNSKLSTKSELATPSQARFSDEATGQIAKGRGRGINAANQLAPSEVVVVKK